MKDILILILTVIFIVLPGKTNGSPYFTSPLVGSDSSIILTMTEASEWTKCYGEGKEFRFISNFCVIDTLNVTDVYIDKKDSVISVEGSTGTVAGYTFVINREYSRMHGSLFIGEENDSLQMRGVLYHRHTGTGDSIMAVPFKPEDYTLYGRTFRDCVVIDSLNSCYSGEAAEVICNKITRYVFSKEYGLIYYRFEDGEEFHRWDL